MVTNKFTTTMSPIHPTKFSLGHLQRDDAGNGPGSMSRSKIVEIQKKQIRHSCFFWRLWWFKDYNGKEKKHNEHQSCLNPEGCQAGCFLSGWVFISFRLLSKYPKVWIHVTWASHMAVADSHVTYQSSTGHETATRADRAMRHGKHTHLWSTSGVRTNASQEYLNSKRSFVSASSHLICLPL